MGGDPCKRAVKTVFTVEENRMGREEKVNWTERSLKFSPS